MDDVIEKTSTGHKISASSAALGILLFFFPWLVASCGGQEIARASGWTIAIGDGNLDGEGAMLLVLFAAIFVLVLAYLAHQRGQLTKLDAYGPMAAGALAILIMIIVTGSISSEASQIGVEIKYLLWYYLSYLCYIAVIYGGYLNLKEVN